MRKYVLAVTVMVACVLLQSTVLRFVAIRGVIPDLMIVFLAALALNGGSRIGQTAGFFGGLAMDAMSLAPFGFHAFTGSLIGFLGGLFKGNLAPDPVLFPLVSVALATILKRLVGAVLVAIFSLNPSLSVIMSTQTLVEIGYNAALAPFVFLLVRTVMSFDGRRGRGFS